jgi:hypothetical protein
MNLGLADTVRLGAGNRKPESTPSANLWFFEREEVKGNFVTKRSRSEFGVRGFGVLSSMSLVRILTSDFCILNGFMLKS